MNQPAEPHGIPALLSLLFPGLGQLVKRQTGRAVMIWVLIGVPAFVSTWALLTPRATARPVFVVIAAGLLSLIALGVWLWGVVDAYNHPAG